MYNEILYHISLSEQRAKINGTLWYLRKIGNIDNYSIHELILKSDKQNQLSSLLKVEKLVYEWYNDKQYYKLLILGYYLNYYNIINNKKIKEFCKIEKITDRNNLDNCSEVCKLIKEYIHENRLNYQMKLYGTINTNLLE